MPKNNIEIRKARLEDLPLLMPLYDKARAFMRACGNATQWVNGYPSQALIRQDIENAHLYVAVLNEEIAAAFTFIIGEDPTYQTIEEGAWLNNKPYGTVHRMVSSGKHKGISDRCIDFCSHLIPNIRIDTHADNLPMRKVINRNGFRYCGIIHVSDGTPRLAYQKEFR